jgi:SPASM domain peptide maturase of grasp-with-spasm system
MKIEMNKPFKIFECCLPVKGYKRSIIADTQRNTFYQIPDCLYLILKEYDGHNITKIQSICKDDNELEILHEYLNFLVNEEIIFFTNRIESFPKMSLKWEEPSIITNAIIDVSVKLLLNFEYIFRQLDEFNCKNLQIRFFDEITPIELDIILSQLENKRISAVELLVKYNSAFDELTMQKICKKHNRISIWTFYSSEKNQNLHFQSNSFGNIFLIKQGITSNLHCGIISSDYFTINIKTFTEAQKHNTCLNRKISIDTEGYIRNCPSMKEHYGNIKDTTLQEALQHPDFKKYWFINKDQIAVCKDCEFRYICTDCRAYIENPEDMYSKPLKCGYNPYTCEWEEWSTNPLKQKAIDHYGMRELVKSA